MRNYVFIFVLITISTNISGQSEDALTEEEVKALKERCAALYPGLREISEDEDESPTTTPYSLIENTTLLPETTSLSQKENGTSPSSVADSQETTSSPPENITAPSEVDSMETTTHFTKENVTSSESYYTTTASSHLETTTSPPENDSPTTLSQTQEPSTRSGQDDRPTDVSQIRETTASSNEWDDMTTTAAPIEFINDELVPPDPTSDEEAAEIEEKEEANKTTTSTEPPMVYVTTIPPVVEPIPAESTREGKQVEFEEPDNIVKENPPLPAASSNDDLVVLIKHLTKKIEDLQATQKILHQNIDELQKKLEESPLLRAKKEETTMDLVGGDPMTAVEKWKELSGNVTSIEELGNVTSNIVEDALGKGAPPTTVMDFVTQLPPLPQVQESAYNTVAQKLNDSQQAQEQLYWRDMTKYCQQASNSIGPNNPATLGMYDAQNQIRLNGARPIAQGSRNIQKQEYLPAISHWLTMVRDIPDSPPSLERNMKRLMIRTYEGSEINLPLAFHFILILPLNQGYYKQVAYKCLRQEMKQNGHYYNPDEYGQRLPIN